MNKNQLINYLGSLVVLVAAIIGEWNSDFRLYAYISVLIIIIVIGVFMLLTAKITNLTESLPDNLKFLRQIMVRFMRFLQPYVKGFLFLTLLIVVLITQSIIIKTISTILIIVTYFFELRKEPNVLEWTQGKSPLFQENFNDRNLRNWIKLEGSAEKEENFGNPAPDVLLRQAGNPPATPQTFISLKEINIKRPVSIECDVYIEQRGIFNLVFGISGNNNSYFMARLDARETEFDGLLYKSQGEQWNFIIRSDRHRTLPRSWHRVRLEINSSKKVSFYKDGELIVTRELMHSAFGKLGLMNEEADVHVDNLLITQL